MESEIYLYTTNYYPVILTPELSRGCYKVFTSAPTDFNGNCGLKPCAIFCGKVKYSHLPLK